MKREKEKTAESPAGAIERLEKYGIRPSVQRIAVMDFLLTHPIHPTVDQIYAALQPSMPTLSRATVYNCLHLFLEHHAILALSLDEKNIRYDGTLQEHAHFMCTRCGTFSDIDMTLPDAVKKVPQYTISEVQLYYKGLCPACTRAEQHTKK